MKLKAPATILWSLLIAAGCMPGLIGAAPGTEPEKYDFKIDSQPLGTALQALAAQSGVQIIFFRSSLKAFVRHLSRVNSHSAPPWSSFSRLLD